MGVVLAASLICFGLFVFVISCIVVNCSFLAFISFTTFIWAFTLTHFIRDLDLFSYAFPNCIDTITIIEAFKDAITANHDKIKVVLNFEALNIGVTHNHIWISSISRTLGLNVSKGLWNWESAWKYSERSLYIKVFLAWMSCCFSKCLCPINLSSCSLDSVFLQVIIRLVITGEHTNLSTSINWHNSTWVSNIYDVYNVINYHYNSSTWPRSLRPDILTGH